MNLHIEITQEQHEALIELLNDVEALYGHEAASLARMDHPVARELAAARLDAIGSAQDLIALLARY